MPTIPTVSCFGSGKGKGGDPLYDAMCMVGRILAERKITVVTGGHGGVGMEAPCRGAYEVRGDAVGYCLPNRKSNAYLTKSHWPHILFPNLNIEAMWGIRLGYLLESDGFIVAGWDPSCAGDGEPGTATELLAAFTLNSKIWSPKKRLAILHPPDVRIPGWNTEMLDLLMEWGMLPRDVRPYIHVTRTPQEAVDWVIGVANEC